MTSSITEDKQNKSMLLTTNAHRYNHDAHDRLRGNRGYKHIIAPLMSIEPKKKSGKGLPCAMTLNDNAIDYVHWDDPNELGSFTTARSFALSWS